MQEWDYKVLVVNQDGRVEYIDGQKQAETEPPSSVEASRRWIYQSVDENGSVRYKNKRYCKHLNEILPKLEAEGWEMHDTEEVENFLSGKFTYYTLIRPLEEDEFSD